MPREVEELLRKRRVLHVDKTTVPIMRFDRQFVALNVDVTAVTCEEIERVLKQNHINVGKQDVKATSQHMKNCHCFHIHLVGKRVLIKVGRNGRVVACFQLKEDRRDAPLLQNLQITLLMEMNREGATV